jgi:hypothetical protein
MRAGHIGNRENQKLLSLLECGPSTQETRETRKA